MKRMTLLLSAIWLLPAGGAIAETEERSGFVPLETQAFAGGVTEQLAQSRSKPRRVVLPAALPQDVDANGDGRISFEELARHDLSEGF